MILITDNPNMVIERTFVLRCTGLIANSMGVNVPSFGKDVESEMRRHKKGTAKSGRGGKGGKVKSKKQVIDIGLSKARKEGKRYPKRSPILKWREYGNVGRSL